MDARLDEIIRYLNRKQIRATYGAVADTLGVPAVAIGRLLGERRQEVSWVVSAENGMPSGYEARELHPQLTASNEVISCSSELLERMGDSLGELV